LILSGKGYVFLSNIIAPVLPLISASPYTNENVGNSPIDTKSTTILENLISTIKALGDNNKTLLLFYPDSNQPKNGLMNKSGLAFK